jgi:deoxyribonuclease-4
MLTKKYLLSEYPNKSKTQSIRKNYKLLIGCHTSITPSVLDGIQYAQSIGSNAVQIFLGSNRSSSMKMKTKFTDSDISEIRKYITQKRIVLIIHSIYLLNFCKGAPISGKVRYMHENLLHDMQVGAQLGAQCVVLHLGFKKKMPTDVAMKNLIDNINYILTKAPSGIQLSLETSAGRGSEMGYTLEELAAIWNGVKHNGAKKIGICIDTAHIFVSGYDISTVEGIKDYMRRFNSLIGWEHITNFHINDSRYPLGSRHDEHRGIGSGLVYTKPRAMEALRWIKNFALRRGIPMILETHGSAREGSEGSRKGAHGYEWEIGLIRGL